MELSDKLVAAAMKNLEKLLISKGLTAESLISKFDIDGDGLINLDEFDKGLTRLTGSPAPRSYLRPIFSAIDIDGNGTLSQNELMSLLGVENKTIASTNSLVISDHPNDKYNGKYVLQSSNINNKSWYMNSNNCRLYFYNANDGGAPSWSLDNREQNGAYDWYDGGWTRVPADQNIPLGVRRFVGAGKITISESSDETITNDEISDSPIKGVLQDSSIQLSDESKPESITDLAEKWSDEFEQMIESPSSPEMIDSIFQDVNVKFEEEVSQLPIYTQAPIRAIWKIKSDSAVTVAKTKLYSDNAKIVTGLGVTGVALGTALNVKLEESLPPIESEKPETSQDWHNDHHVEAPDRVERVSQMSSEEWGRTHDVDAPDRVELPDRVTVGAPISSFDSNVEVQKQEIEPVVLDKSVTEISSPIINESSLSLDEIFEKMNGARFLNEQRELISSFKGQILDLSFRVSSVDRTFGIGISEEYKNGNTLFSTSNSHEIEVRVKKEFDTSNILSGTDMNSSVSVIDWNGIRKRLVVNLY
jgi:hypothetical protein|tara:strand:- start:27 stop:1619 length:1593 start_codon:yes stop_codon:yes gene_type:complete